MKILIGVFLLSFAMASVITNTTTHKSCQGYMGPPDELFYNHSMPDYTGQEPSFSQYYIDLMSTRMAQYAQLILQEAPSTWNIWEDLEGSDEQAAWIFYGTGGRALAFLNYHHALEEKNETLSREALYIAKDYIDKAISNLTIDTKFIGFLKGHPGIYSLGAVIYHLLGDEQKAQSYYNLVIEQFKNLSSSNGMGYDQGVAGLLFCSEFLKAYFDRDIIDHSLIVAAGELIMSTGIDHAFENGTMQWPDQSFTAAQWLGQGMGSTGIVYRLLRIPEIVVNQTYQKHIKLTLEFFMNRQTSSGQMLDYETSTMPGMHLKVQWCHGAPGLIPVFAEASQVFGNETYLEKARLAARYTWQFGIVKKGMALCHGTAGNAYMLLYLFKITKEPEFLYYFYEFHKYALNEATLTDPEYMISYDCSAYSAFLDTAGSLLAAYGDFSSHFQEGMDKLNMPGWGAPAIKMEQHSSFLQAY